MSTRVENPYQDLPATWLRGSFHGHSAWASRCASVPLRSALARYRTLGAAFTAVTNHDHVTSLRRFRRRHPEMVLLEGFEHSRGENLLFVGERVAPLHHLPLAQAMLAANGLLTVACHPRPRAGEEHWSVGMLTALPRLPDGVEVYNGHYGVHRMVAKGCVPLYREFWDECLSAGLHLWGFANDDSHDPDDFGNAWNMVAVEDISAASIVSSARAGRFYATTGLLPARMHGDGASLSVGFAGPVTGRFVGPGGQILVEGTGRSFEHKLGPEAYARFEAESVEGLLFLQPVFRGEY